ncbi:MAG: DinB family protein [Actinomycetota bacterium]
MPDPVVAAAREILEDSLDQLRAAVEGCSVEQLNRRPAGDDTNGLAVLATHALHSTRAWLGLAVDAQVPPRDRPAEFRVVVEDADAFRRGLDDLSASCRALLDADAAFEPERTGVASWMPPQDREPVSAAWALIHALAHLREHVGHAQLTRQVV